MSTTQIPPVTDEPTPSRVEGGDLYDSQNWESAYRQMYQVPALLVQLQDEVSRSRKREAYWISIIVHLFFVILIVNSTRLERLLPRRPVMMVSPNDVLKQKDLTYLELPPDQQKATKRPDTNIISDKDRNAMSRAPKLNREELKKILGGARPGRPGPQVPSQPPQSSPPAPQNMPQQAQAQPQQAPPQPAANQQQTARLQAPAVRPPQPSFNTGVMSPGSAIEQAARAAAANRGGYSGDNGDYGLNPGAQPSQVVGPLDVLSDTMGVDFGPYLARVLHDVRENWYNLIPEAARAPLMKKGKVSIEFVILKDGKVAGMRYVSGSGDVALDRAAYGGITASNPFPPLPGEFGGPYLALRFHFFYNPDKSDLQ
ncbi:MAG: TonB family protein [Terriglobales bacterium]